MYITCDLLGPLLTVVWTTNINSRLPQTRTPHVSTPAFSGAVSKPCHKIRELGKKGRETTKVTRDFATPVSLTSL